MKSAITETRNYDAVGNRTTVGATAPAPGTGSYTTNALNQYTALGAEVLLYDARGNLTSKGLSASYSYDSKNRLLSATVSGNTASIAYDYRNRPVSRTINAVTTYFVYDGWNLIAEYNSGGAAPLAEYVHGSGVDEILLKHDTIHGSVFYHQDGLGSTTHLTDVIGMVVESYRYDVFGAVSITDQLGGALTSSFYGNRFLFTGREWIAEIGLYDYRNRVYSPELGRFIQADPIRFDAGDVNIYRYVGNNALNGTDPDGRMGPLGVFAAKGLLGAISGAIASYAQELAEQIASGEDMDSCALKNAAAAGAIGGAIGGLIADPIAGGALGGIVAGAIQGAGKK